MDSRKIAFFIRRANLRLKLQYLAKMVQFALCFALAAALLVMVISRLSIFPYYEFYAYLSAALSMTVILVISIRKVPGRHHAIKELDQFTAHNQLLTLSQIQNTNLLAANLAAKIEKDIHLSYQLFKKEKNNWFSPKSLLISLGLVILLLVSGLFPASTQLAAIEQERERELIEELIETVEEQKKQAGSPIVQKELESLQEKLLASETSEQALRELVKKQKEMELKKQLKEQEGSAQADNEAEDLKKASDKLAEQAGDIQTALSGMGKPVAFDLQRSIAANEISGNSGESNSTESGSEDSESDSQGEGQQGNGNDDGNIESSNQGQGDAVQDGSGQTPDSSGTGNTGTGQDGTGSSNTSSDDQEGSSTGQGRGQGHAADPGTGSGAGKGQGSRELLSIPSRIGGTGETAIDSGELSEGAAGSYEKGTVDAELGSVRPYQEVVKSYSDAYFSSAERMQLPSDLQNIVEQYFSEIQGD